MTDLGEGGADRGGTGPRGLMIEGSGRKKQRSPVEHRACAGWIMMW